MTSPAGQVGTLDMFEVREGNGALLLVTSDGTAARAAATKPDDTITRRPWMQVPLGAALLVVKRADATT